MAAKKTKPPSIILTVKLSCGSCDFWLDDETTEQNHGWCKRYPKTVIGTDNGNPFSLHPIEIATEPACGEYRKMAD